MSNVDFFSLKRFLYNSRQNHAKSRVFDKVVCFFMCFAESRANSMQLLENLVFFKSCPKFLQTLGFEVRFFYHMLTVLEVRKLSLCSGMDRPVANSYSYFANPF